MTSKTALDTVAAGDVLIRMRDGTKHLAVVDRVTPKRIHVSGETFDKTDGRALGRFGFGRRPLIRLPEVGEVEALRAAAEKANEEAVRDRAARRESLRGRTIGYLLATRDALDAAADDAGADRDKERYREMALLVYHAEDNLRDAERACRASAGYLRDAATRLEQRVEADTEYGFGVGYQAIVQAAENDRLHAVAVRHGHDMIRAAALLLNLTTAELVAPMAKAKAVEAAR